MPNSLILQEITKYGGSQIIWAKYTFLPVIFLNFPKGKKNDQKSVKNGKNFKKCGATKKNKSRLFPRYGDPRCPQTVFTPLDTVVPGRLQIRRPPNFCRYFPGSRVDDEEPQYIVGSRE
jgi:hypothetical protein